MLKRLLLVIAIAVSSFGWAIPAQATECKPGKCTGGCKVNPNARIDVDPSTGSVQMDPPIRCYA